MYFTKHVFSNIWCSSLNYVLLFDHVNLNNMVTMVNSSKANGHSGYHVHIFLVFSVTIYLGNYFIIFTY